MSAGLSKAKSPSRSARPLVLLLAGWAIAYGSLYAVEQTQLLTNGFDLSVFDYALWSTLKGQPGQVPFLGHSLFAEHFMPTLLALLPPYLVWQSPVALLAMELLVVAGAGLLLHRVARRTLPESVAMALTAAFLFSRRTHSGIEAWFHIEALEPLLIFGLVWAADGSRWWWYAVCAALALGCKEDVPVYLGLFGAYMMLRGPSRKAGLATVVVSAAWLLFAFSVAIPAAREAQGLPRTNPFVGARFGDPAVPGVSATVLAARIFSLSSAQKIVNITSSVAFLCWSAPGLLVVALPGVAASLAGRADSLQAGLVGHYIWPVLPWVFLAAINGSRRLLRRWPDAAAILVALLVGITLVDSPLWRVVARRPWRQADAAAAVKAQLRVIPADAAVLAQASLIPHLPHRSAIQAIGRELSAERDADYIAVSTVGDLWPLDVDASAALIERLKRDSRYTAIASGPLFLFRRER